MIPAAKYPPLSAPEATLEARVLEGQGLDLTEPLSRFGVLTAMLIGGFTALRLLVLATTQIANGEAYYYVWSRFPSWSYYDHPPLVAWITWLTTRFGTTDFYIRLGSVFCSALFGLLVYRLASRLFSPRAGFIAVAIVTLLPVFFVTSYVVNPEAPLAPLWVLFLLLLEGMRRHDEPWRPLTAGLVVGAAFLAKYSGVLLVMVGVSYLAAVPTMRRWFSRPSLYLGGAIALVVALPVILWNYQRGWPSLTLHFVERTGPTDPLTLLDHAFHAFMGQFGPFHPLIFPGLLVALFFTIRRAGQDARYRFLSIASWPVLLFFVLMMVRVRDPESHWTMVGYIPVAIAAGGLIDEVADTMSASLRWYLRISAATGLIAILAVYGYSQVPRLRTLLPASMYDRNKDFLTEMLGWDELRRGIEGSLAQLGNGAVVASCQYALCSHILKTLDDQPSVYCPGLRRTEFDFIGRRDPPAGVPVLYVTDDHYHDDPAILLPDRDCQPLRTVTIERDGLLLQNYQLSACLPKHGE
jgi:hypothetical protein